MCFIIFFLNVSLGFSDGRVICIIYLQTISLALNLSLDEITEVESPVIRILEMHCEPSCSKDVVSVHMFFFVSDFFFVLYNLDIFNFMR